MLSRGPTSERQQRSRYLAAKAVYAPDVGLESERYPGSARTTRLGRSVRGLEVVTLDRQIGAESERLECWEDPDRSGRIRRFFLNLMDAALPKKETDSKQ